jgi:hypothetical protein
MKQLFRQPMKTADGSLSFFGFFWLMLAVMTAFMTPIALINF